jgi:CubicO group peptidase (beta-lactamase class C family)
MVQRGEVALDEPVEKYLPSGVKMPAHGRSTITLRHLATHTSGLPRDPTDSTSTDPDNPYLPVIRGAGSLRSTAHDRLVFLAAFLGYTRTPLAPAMAAMLGSRQPTGLPGLQVALGWQISTAADHEIVWHNVGLGGCGSFVGYDPHIRVALVVLSNSETPGVADEVGLYLLERARLRHLADENAKVRRRATTR